MIVDDIVSSGHTMIETLGHLRPLGLPVAVCVAIHAVRAGDGRDRLLECGTARVVSRDLLPRPCEARSIVQPLADVCAGLCERAFLLDR